MSPNMVVGVVVRFFLLLTPFFVLSVFVISTDGLPRPVRRRLALRTTIAIWLVCTLVYFFGDYIFKFIGITLAAFQVGAGLLLMLSGIELVRGTATSGIRRAESSGDITVVPMAIPYAVGPGTIGTLLVMSASAENTAVQIADFAGITTAVLITGALLYFCDRVERFLGRKGLDILGKLTGLFLAALAAQVMLTGVKNVFFPQ